MENNTRRSDDASESMRNTTTGSDYGTSREGTTGSTFGTSDSASPSGLESTTGTTVGSSADYSSTGSIGDRRMLTGMFRDRDSAEKAYNSLQSRGYSDKDINVMMSDDTRKEHFGKDDDNSTGLGNKAMEGAGVGSAIGGTLGAIVGAIAAVGTAVALPGLGLVIAGPIAAGLAGAGAGGLTGGLLGALVGSGIPEDRAKEYEAGIKEGGIVMGVNTRSEEDAAYFENEWRNSRGEKIYR